MNDEIKEILDNIKNKYEDYYVQDIVSGNDLKTLLDYITNLQQENERLKMRNDMLRKDIDSFVNDNKVDYKSRVDKAIELLKNTCYSEEDDTFYSDLWKDLPELLRILKGGD